MRKNCVVNHPACFLILTLLLFGVEQKSLGANSIKCLRLDGSMAHAARGAVLEKFRTDSSYRVFLMTLRTGGVGLNLTSASRAILLSPWWNPQVEERMYFASHSFLA